MAQLIGRNNNLQRGSLLLEAVIALAIVAIIIVGYTIAFGINSDAGFDVLSEQEALSISRDGLNIVRTIRDQGWDELKPGTFGIGGDYGSWYFLPEVQVLGAYTRAIVVDQLDDSHMRITSKVTWESRTKEREVSLSTILTPLEEVVYGDWSDPMIISSATIATSYAGTDIDYKNGYIYLTVLSTSDSAPDFFIFDVSDPYAPEQVGSLNLETGLASVAVSGSYAYVVEDQSSDFFIMDISNPSAPSMVSKTVLPGNGKGKTVTLEGPLVMVGLTSGSGGEIDIVDVSSKVTPVVLNSYEVSFDVNKIKAIRGLLYVANANPDRELIILDLENPSSPTVAGYYDAQNKAPAYSVFVKSPSRTFLGREKKDASSKVIYALDTSEPSNITFLDQQDADDRMNDLWNAGNLLFTANNKKDKELLIFDTSDISNIQNEGDLKLPGNGTGLVFKNNILYISVENKNALQIITAE